MDSADIAIIIGAVSGLLASIIYGFKNIRESSCGLNGCECSQEIKDDDEPPTVSEV